MTARLDRAIAQLEDRLKGIPLDERVPDNPDYVRLTRLLESFRSFHRQVLQIEKVLDQMGV